MLQLRSISKQYAGRSVLHDLSLSLAGRETLCLLGPSGSGKSTILQLIAGLEQPESGSIHWDGVDITHSPAHTRAFGLVFQDFALFPHLNVFENVAFGLRMQARAADAVARRVEEVLEMVGLSGFRDRSVTRLSGGEQQRVALARALAPRPRLLMLDEPLAALDRTLRDELLEQVRGVLERSRGPAVYVTHDQDEAFAIGDRIALLHGGRIVLEGSPLDVWSSPGSRWAAEFLDLGTVLQGTVETGRRVRTGAGTFRLPCAHQHGARDSVDVLLRPRQDPRGARIGGTVLDVAFRRAGYRVRLDNGVVYDAEQPPRRRSRVQVRLPAECLGTTS